MPLSSSNPSLRVAPSSWKYWLAVVQAERRSNVIIELYLNALGSVVEVNRVIPRRERVSVVHVHHVRLSLLETRQASPVPAALDAKAAGDPRPKAFRPRDLPDKVHLFAGVQLGSSSGYK